MLTRRGFALSSLALPLAGALPGVARAAGAPIVAAIKVTDRRVSIEAMLNGRGPYTLLMDTGAIVSGVKETVAQALALRKLRDVKLNRLQTFPLYAVDELLLGGQVRQPGAAMAGFKEFGRDGDGLLAAGLLTAVDSELDFERQQWRLYPAGGVDRSAYVRLKSELRKQGALSGSNLIFAEVEAGGQKLQPLWDTGSPWPLLLDNATGRKLGLWNDTTPYAPLKTKGVVGLSRGVARLVRGPALRVGASSYEPPLVVVAAPEDRDAINILGLPIIRTQNISVEPAAEALWAARNGLSPTRPGYARSAIWLEADKGVVSVADVGTGSPAAKAGVRAGDVLVGAATIPEGLRQLDGRDGDTIALRLKRGDQAVEARFVLADYL